MNSQKRVQRKTFIMDSAKKKRREIPLLRTFIHIKSLKVSFGLSDNPGPLTSEGLAFVFYSAPLAFWLMSKSYLFCVNWNLIIKLVVDVVRFAFTQRPSFFH